MPRLARLVLTVAFAAALAAPALAQSPAKPSDAAPAEKMDPAPIRPDLTAPPAPSGGDDLLGVPARVWAVRIAGGWEADGRRGFSRLVGTFEGDRQRLTVQWLAEPDGRVIESKVLGDEEAAKLTFGDFRAEPEDRGGVTIFLDTLPDADGLRDTWVLIVGGPGEARFGPATN